MITVFILDDHIKSQSIPSEDLTDLPDLCLLSILVFIIRKIDSNSLKRKAVLEGKPLRTDNNSNNLSFINRLTLHTNIVWNIIYVEPLMTSSPFLINLLNTKTWISPKRKKIFQKGKQHLRDSKNPFKKAAIVFYFIGTWNEHCTIYFLLHIVDNCISRNIKCYF